MDLKLCSFSIVDATTRFLLAGCVALAFVFSFLDVDASAHQAAGPGVAGPSEPSAAKAEEEDESSPPQAPPSIADRWASIVDRDSVRPEPKAASSPLRQQPTSGGWAELQEQLFFQLSVDYTHNWTTFTGDPTLIYLVNEGPPFTITPDGFVNFPEAYENNDDRLYTRLRFGTKGYGSDRVNTYVSLVSYHDLDGTSAGSPFISNLDSYDGRSRFSLVNAYFEMEGLGGEGFLSDVDLRVGRQYIQSYGNPLYPLGAGVMDGASVDYRNERLNLGGFVGSRSDIFSSPESRFLTGFNFGTLLGDRAYFNYDILYYAGSAVQNFSIEPRWDNRLLLRGFFRMVEDKPVDVGLKAAYATANWGWNASLTDRVSNDDFLYDIFLGSRADNLYNRVPRLYLTGTQPSFRFSADGYRRVASWLSLGGRFWLYQLHDAEDTAGFEASFREYAASAAITPGENWQLTGEYRYRDLDRGSPLGAKLFDDIAHAGESNYQEFVGSVGWGNRGRVKTELGVYYRLFDLQNRIFLIDDSKTNGVFANVFWRINRNFNLRVIYGSDNDYAVFNPDISRQNGLRIGFDFIK